MSWQEKLLPLMTWMIIGLTIFFFVASFIQLYYLHQKIDNGPVISLPEAAAFNSGSIQTGKELDYLQLMQWETLAALDEHTLNLRYHQANILLMARIWTRYLSFVTGMILCLVGSTFILGKIEVSPTVGKGGSEAFKFSIRTSSPGIILALLGTALMMTSVLVHNEIDVTDGPAYLHLKFQAVKSEAPKKLDGCDNVEQKATDNSAQQPAAKDVADKAQEKINNIYNSIGQ